MSDQDLQDNSVNKQINKNTQDKDVAKNNNLFDSKMQNVVNFDEIPTIKDSKPSDDHKKIDFFGADLQNDHDNEEDNDIMNANDFEQLAKDFAQENSHNNNNPFG